MIRKWAKEPFLHFIVLGAVIFLVYGLINTKEDSDKQIVIDNDKLNHISALWELQWKRQPSFDEMQVLVANYIRQEVLYREALRMNLDHNDEIVKRRLSQKMEFMAGDLTKVVEPATETKLQGYFEAHKEDYRIPASYSFNHILISKQNHLDARKYASELLVSIDNTDSESLKDRGDKTMLSLHFEAASKTSITRELGETFYKGLDDLPINQWAGPIHSSFGEHLVYKVHKTDSNIPELAEVKEKVIRDYEYNTEITAKNAIYKEMKKNYEVIISSKDLNADQKESLLANLKTEQ